MQALAERQVHLDLAREECAAKALKDRQESATCSKVLLVRSDASNADSD